MFSVGRMATTSIKRLERECVAYVTKERYRMRVSYACCHCFSYGVDGRNIVKSSFMLRRFTIGASSDIEIVSYLVCFKDSFVFI